MNLARKFTILIILFTISSCDPVPKSWGWEWWRPRPLSGMGNFPPPDTEYGRGFQDGCGASFDASAKGLLSDIHGRKFDYKRHKNSPDYNQGWFDGTEQCLYILDWYTL